MQDNFRNPLQKLLTPAGPPMLGPGPRLGVRAQVELETELKSILRAARLPDLSRDLVRALVLLWHDHLDAAHTIAQGIENSDGSLVHAILHRRAADYGNSKYWFRRVGKHPCFPELARRVTALLESKNERELLTKLVARGEWDAFAFVDACDAGRESELLREIQQVEFEVLLEHVAVHGTARN